ncbi:MAG: cytochrome c [Rhodobacteraceae bacterium]|nr:cytochrome c [Paracoccaceae bacterium]
MKKILTWVLVAVAVIGGGLWLSQTKPAEGPLSAGEIIVPSFTALAAEGEKVYLNSCAACHGVNLAGTNDGPSLLDFVYRPAHHSDYAFVSAVQNGVTAHHWNFGNMPRQTQVTDEELVRVISYIREVQRANGLN